MAVTREEIIEALKGMTLLEASELVKDIEETFGVSAAAPVAVAAVGAARHEVRRRRGRCLPVRGSVVHAARQGRAQRQDQRRCQDVPGLSHIAFLLAVLL